MLGYVGEDAVVSCVCWMGQGAVAVTPGAGDTALPLPGDFCLYTGVVCIGWVVFIQCYVFFLLSFFLLCCLQQPKYTPIVPFCFECQAAELMAFC